MQTENVSYLNQEVAKNVDKELMEEYGWSMDSLMELAGLSVAQVVDDSNQKYHNSSLKKVLVLIGSGNNGGDGYVAASHLKQFGYEPQVLQFKKPEKELYINLTKRCQSYNINVLNYQDDQIKADFSKFVNDNFDLVIDGIFGFSFHGPVKEPYDRVLNELKNVSKPIFSIDIPSGWEVEGGNVNNSFEPSYVISLTLPKGCMEGYKGKHYLGGRFIPEKMAQKYGWKVPQYSGSQQFIQLS